MILGPDPRYWKDPWLDMYLEREAILWADGVPDSAAKAEADIRRQAEPLGQGEIFTDMANMRRFGK
jgi:hypothetical protein